MSRLIQKRGFTLSETMIVIVILGCLIALAVGMFNMTKFRNETMAAKQLKMESALKAATMSIVRDSSLSAQQACNATYMRDKYAEKLNGRAVDNVTVNGVEVPAIAIDDYGVIAFDTANDCVAAWYSTGSSPAASAAVSDSKAGSGDDSAFTTATNNDEEDKDNDIVGASAPADLSRAVLVYAMQTDRKAGAENIEINVPANVSSSGVASANTTSYSANTSVASVNSSGYTYLYGSGTSPILAAASNSFNNDISVCAQGSDYSFVSTCTDTDGSNISVAFYQMLNENTCVRQFCPGNGYDNNGELVTSGQINLLCKNGTDSGSVGQCNCPEGKKYWAGVYSVDNSNIYGICVEDCSVLGMVQDGTLNSCVCPDGTTWNNTLKQCVTPGTCPYDYLKYNEQTAECICKTEEELGPDYFDVCEEWVNNPSMACKKLRDNWDKTTGTCVCPVPFTQDGSDCLCLSPRSLNSGVCECDATKVQLTGEEIFDSSAENCKLDCAANNLIANADKTACISPDCGCLKKYDRTTGTCVCDDTQADNTQCLNSDEKFDASSSTCKSCKSPNREYDSYGICQCKAKSALTLGTYEIYDTTRENCIYVCKDGAVANADHTECIGACLEEYDYVTETLNCIAHPTDAKTTECLHNLTNYVSDPTAPTCMVECLGQTSPNDVYKECRCDEAKVATALTQEGNLNKIYDLDNPTECMMACQGQFIPSADRRSCVPVDCLKETTDNITQHCIANPTAQDAACLSGNYVADPSNANTCSRECSGVTKANTNHLTCVCDESKVATALTQSSNLNKIYKLDTPPACMEACTNQTIPASDRRSCVPVDCLKETTDNVTQHCINNPSDDKTTACLINTNRVASTNDTTTCSVDCGDRKSPNTVHKQCICDINKMATKYSSNRMHFDATAANCESVCSPAYLLRDENNAAACKCPSTKPAEITVQNGYFYDVASAQLTGPTACQTECPRTNIYDWIRIHFQLFTKQKTVMSRLYFVTIYDSTKAECLYDCEGNLVANDDKTECICPITANDCVAGQYFDAAACECKPCTVGHYCPPHVTEPIPCPCGTYGNRTDLSTAECSGKCPAGYYCPEASVNPTAIRCTEGNTCPEGSCAPTPCVFPATNNDNFTICDKCQTEAQIRAVNPNYFGVDEVYVNDLSLNCKKCKSNMVYVDGVCQCPPDKPYWNGVECSPCQDWGQLFFARTSKSKPTCTLYDHMLGKQGACFDYERKTSDAMRQAANALSSADKNRTFSDVYAYMVSYKDGRASVVGVFTARSWYMTFNTDDSSEFTKKSTLSDGTCAQVCGNNAECVTTCNYMKGKVTANTMFNSCVYAVNNQYYGNTYNNGLDELCSGGQLKVANPNECTYQIGGILRNAISPIVLDLKGNGFKFTSVEDGVVFDLSNDGVPEKTAWTGKQKSFDNAFLVLDKNKNGQVDNGGELFGDQNGAENGFMELAKYDDNKDGVINDQDKVYNELLLWVDFNNNAKVDYEADGTTKELKTLKDAGVTELSVNYEIQKDSNGNILKDIYGNITGFLGSFKMMVQNAAGKLVEAVHKMMDVFFVTQ